VCVSVLACVCVCVCWFHPRSCCYILYTTPTPGVLIGCLLGMCSLLFMDLDKGDRIKRRKELETIFSTLLEDG
jgi:hypothetical protein